MPKTPPWLRLRLLRGLDPRLPIMFEHSGSLSLWQTVSWHDQKRTARKPPHLGATLVWAPEMQQACRRQRGMPAAAEAAPGLGPYRAGTLCLRERVT